MNRSNPSRALSHFLVATVVLAVILGYLFSGSFKPEQVVFSNDGPLGVVKSEALKMPDASSGYWVDLHWLGTNGGFSPACLTYGLLWLLGPVGFAKFYPLLALLFLGVAGWTFFRAIKVPAVLCVVATIGVALNSNYFSNTCWGLGSRATTLGFIFLALAALSARKAGNPWSNAALAGLATGMAVVEGADIGVILSLFVGMFVIWQSIAESSSVKNSAVKGVRLLLVVPFALFMATQSLIPLFKLASQGTASAQVSQEAKDFNWSFATQWSLPPAETLRVIVPGLYGYRMDSPDGGCYWGRVAETPGYPGTRSSGAGEYAGVLVVLLAVFSFSASFAGTRFFTTGERKMIWFWAVMFLIAMVLSWGRFAPAFYKIVYSLPYFSSIRNPMKFMHAGHMVLMILSGYGLLALGRRYLERPVLAGGIGAWWSKADRFEKRWTIGMFAAVAVAAFVFLIYSSSKTGLVRHLETAQLPANTDAKTVAEFSIAEVGKTLLFFGASAAALFLTMGGVLSRRRGLLVAVVMGLILTVDLVRANKPWVIIWDYPYKYATNPILDTLKEKPYEGRVVSPAFLMEPRALPPEKKMAQYFPAIYGVEWVQHHFQYYNIQSIDVAQDVRAPADKKAYMATLATAPGRLWQLTNTRYVIGMAGFQDALNAQFDKGRNRFKIADRFDVAPKPGKANLSSLEDLTAVRSPDGALALFEFTGALPRAKFFTSWLVSTNDDAVLKTLTDEAFDPLVSVVLSKALSVAPATNTPASAGKADIVSYSPRRVEVKVDAPSTGVLLLNDRFDKDWVVTVDGKPSEIFRANFIMRGVELTAGQHTVVYEFRPSLKGLKIGLVAILVGAVFIGLMCVLRQREDEASGTSSPAARA